MMTLDRVEKFVIAAILVMALSLLICSLTAQAYAAPPPNFVHVILDDSGTEDFDGRYATPNIQSIGRFGVTYTQFYGAAMCSPSRAAAVTGKYPERFGIDNALSITSPLGVPSHVTTLAENLKGLGYQTALVGKQHLGRAPQYLPNSQGYDFFYGMVVGELRSYDTHIARDGTVDWWRNGQRIYKKEYTTTAITREALGFIDRAHNAKKPFYIHVAYEAPHVPWQLPGAKIDSSHPADYGKMLQMVDTGVGQILKKINAIGNTYIIITGDNGGYAGHNGNLRGVKAHMWEGGLRVYAAMEGPRIPPSVDNRPLIMQDIYPTFVRLAGGTSPGVDGRDILGGDNSPRNLYWSMSGVNRAVRSGPWKFVQEAGEEYLFNLAENPNESVNLITENPGIASDLRNDLTAWHARVYNSDVR